MKSPQSADAERLALFRLTLVEGLGSARIKKLLDRFGSAEAVLAGGRETLTTVPGIGPKLRGDFPGPDNEEKAREELARLPGLGIRHLIPSDDEYLKGLREITVPPVVLSIRGEILPTDRLAVAVVGSRRCSNYGRQMAHRLATGLAARGVTIVSGLARGIDSVAHRAALEAGGRTIAVLASGLANVYPPEHVELAEEIVRHGALLSEAPLDGPPIGSLFLPRNRIISGLSIGVVVVEAGQRSGALSTARHALDQNREVFAVPGRSGDFGSEGTNRLIQQGAALVTCVEDILEQLGPVEIPQSEEPHIKESQPAPPPGSNEVETKLYCALSSEPIEFEKLLEQTSLRASEASASLLMLEMKKVVRRYPGNSYARE